MNQKTRNVPTKEVVTAVLVKNVAIVHVAAAAAASRVAVAIAVIIAAAVIAAITAAIVAHAVAVAVRSLKLLVLTLDLPLQTNPMETKHHFYQLLGEIEEC